MPKCLRRPSHAKARLSCRRKTRKRKRKSKRARLRGMRNLEPKWLVGQPPPHQLVLAYKKKLRTPKTKDGDTEDAAECVESNDASQVEAIFELADAQEAHSSTDSDSDSYNPPDFLCESSSDDSDLPEGSTDELDA